MAPNQTSVLSILSLILSALAVALFGTPAVVLGACFCGASVGVLFLYQMNSGRRPAKLTELLAAALLTGYCGGCAITASICGLDQHGITAPDYAVVPAAWVSYTIILALIACAVLLIAAWFEPKLFRPSEFVTVGRREEWLLWIGLTIVLTQVVAGQFGYEGASASEGTNRVTFLSEIAGSFLLIMLPLSAIGWMQASGFRRLRFGLIVLVSLVLTVPVGRRAFVYSLLVTAFAATQLSGVRLSISRQTKLLVGGVALAAALGATVLFLSIRLASDNLGPGNHPLSELTEETREVFQNPVFVYDVTIDNLEGRPFLLTQYLSLLTKGGNMPAPMYGADLAFGVKMLIPDYFYKLYGRNKDPLREINTEEGLANEHFHLPVFDDANSLLTAGVIDLGLFGIVVYPAAMCFFWRLLAFDVERICGRTGRLLFLLTALNLFLQAEVELGGYLVHARDTLIILGIWTVMPAILPVQGRKERSVMSWTPRLPGAATDMLSSDGRP